MMVMEVKERAKASVKLWRWGGERASHTALAQAEMEVGAWWTLIDTIDNRRLKDSLTWKAVTMNWSLMNPSPMQLRAEEI